MHARYDIVQRGLAPVPTYLYNTHNKIMRVLYLIYIIDVKYEFLIIVNVFVTRYATIHITRYITIYYYYHRYDRRGTILLLRTSSCCFRCKKDSAVRLILALRTR
jgi:hypothetical protein